jgi:hypothetical protein
MTWRRRLLLWVGAGLVVGFVLYFSTSWSSGFDPSIRCDETISVSKGLPPPSDGAEHAFITHTANERIPPRLRCTEQDCGPEARADVPETCHGGQTGSYLVNPRAEDWLVLGALSAGGGLFLSAIVAVVLVLVRRFVGWPPRRNPLLWINRE